ncbi:sin3 histone deacetylase corepressor complex component SDS3 [Dermatophagoides farinae]|uniref:Sin3 histone deacetylase corepressor complex component SDS3 n=2 Tax=Dermatophagoides farinae TaxID=6954 RepID=A0A922HMW1_DERFA|nr:sin3 histone deacetylase corepressor complex component SDS3-like [Dermatophagoides farinae]KAH9497799.1 Sin3 histone deacetylase corepressor complex component SDS3 [Dermatophagoides farinae]
MMNDYDYDIDNNHDYGDSDEDTEDASETESMKYYNDDGGYIGGNGGGGCGGIDEFDSTYEIKEQIYQDKLSHLESQLIHLENGSHPDYLRQLDNIDFDYRERSFFIECNFKLEQKLIENEYNIEESAAIKEFRDRKDELIESLISDLEEKKKIMETDNNLELVNDTSEPKTLTTRKLRRRPNDPTPLPDRRRRTSPAQINFLLEDSEINEDLKFISKILFSKSSNNHHRNSSNSQKNYTESDTVGIDARIDYGKLFYDKKWFHRGQNILLESSLDGTITPSIIVQIGSNEILVKKSNDSGNSTKIKVTLNDLHSKKYSIQRRT